MSRSPRLRVSIVAGRSLEETILPIQFSTRGVQMLLRGVPHILGFPHNLPAASVSFLVR